MMRLTDEELHKILCHYGIESFDHIEEIDSSHGEDDLRYNYIIDKKYVLRVNSVNVMDHRRIADLNVLIQRYRDFGVKAPLFILNDEGNYLIKWKGYHCYLSEYLDYKTAEDMTGPAKMKLISERLIFISKFAEKYQNVPLTEIMSMYSLFDLSPYDQMVGIDEKQQNLNDLIQHLERLGENKLIQELKNVNHELRKQLLSFYKELPYCVFQGDENFSNLCIDEKNHIIGLFDFNMSGKEVIANYLANLACLNNLDGSEEAFVDKSVEEILVNIFSAYRENTKLIEKYYSFSPKEKEAYKLYSKIVMLSGYANVSAYVEYLGNHPKKIVQLLTYLVNASL